MSKEAIDIELISAEVHKAYCDERIRQGKEPYWTGGDYNKLDEATKDYDRTTVKAVLKAIAILEKEPDLQEAIGKAKTARAIARVAEPNKAGQEAIVQYLDQAIAILEKEPDPQKLQEENKQLKEDLTEFGRHGPGCSNQYGKKYRCKCGWLQVEQALSTDGGQTNEGASLEKSAQGGMPPSVKKGE